MPSANRQIPSNRLKVTMLRMQGNQPLSQAVQRLFGTPVVEGADGGLIAVAGSRDLHLRHVRQDFSDQIRPTTAGAKLNPCVCSVAGPSGDGAKVQPLEPLVGESRGRSLYAPLNEDGFTTLYKIGACVHGVLVQLHTHAGNAFRMGRDTGNGVYGPSNLDVSIGEQADVEAFHSGDLPENSPIHIGPQLLAGNACDGFDVGAALSGYLFLLPSGDRCLGHRLSELGQELRKSRRSVRSLARALKR